MRHLDHDPYPLVSRGASTIGRWPNGEWYVTCDAITVHVDWRESVQPMPKVLGPFASFDEAQAEADLTLINSALGITSRTS